MQTIQFTDDFIKNGLFLPEGADPVEYQDSEHPRVLCIHVKSNCPADRCYFALLPQRDGIARRAKFAYLSLPLAEARRRAAAMLEEAHKTIAKQQARAAGESPTLSEFFEETYLPYDKTRRPKQYERDRAWFSIEAEQSLGHLRLSEISREDVAVFHAGLLIRDGIYALTADTQVSVLIRVLELAVKKNLLKANPARGVVRRS